jgi:hypothetical protein
VIRSALAIAALLAVTAAPVRADDDDDDTPDVQRMRFAERGDDLVVSTSLTRIFDSSAYEGLDTGFASTVVIRMWVYRAGSGEPISFQLLQRRCVFDLWDEVYDVRLDGPGGRVTKKVKFRADALKLLASLDEVPIARLVDIPYEEHHVLAIEAELNPVSQQTLAEVRRWLTQGTGGGLDRGGSFFGSFVSVFVNPKVAAADRVIRIQSQPFFRPKP